MGEWVLKNGVNEDWITLLLLCNFMLISVIKLLFKHRFNALIRFYDSALYLNIYAKEKRFINLFHVLFGVFSLVNFSLLIHLFLAHYQWVEHELTDFLLLFGSVLSVVTIRILLNLGGSLLLQIDSPFENYTFLNTTYFFQSSVLLFFGLVLYQYALPKTFININSLLIGYLLLWGYTQVNAILNHYNFLKQGLLYFILYLCTFKLTPWVLLFSKL